MDSYLDTLKVFKVLINRPLFSYLYCIESIFNWYWTVSYLLHIIFFILVESSKKIWEPEKLKLFARPEIKNKNIQACHKNLGSKKLSIGFSGNNRVVFISFLMGVIALVSGCEAKLDLSGVEATKTKSSARYDHYQAMAQSDKAIVLIGNRGVLLTSKDKGNSWTRQILPGSSAVSLPTLIDVDVCPDNHFVVLDADRKVWISDANGEAWTSKNITTEEEVLDLTCDQNGTLWVVGSFTLIMDSRDGGASWTDKSIAEDAMFSRIQFVDGQNGVVTGEFGSVYKTKDGGESWEAANMIPNEFYPMASLFITAEEGWVGGLQGIIFHTSDGGQNWTRQETGTKHRFIPCLSWGRKPMPLGSRARS